MVIETVNQSVNQPIKHTLIFFVNGKKVVDHNPDPGQTLLTYLREKLRLCGTKLGCGEGGCGACTVMISRIDRSTDQIKHLSANACITPVCAVHGMAVVTVEGIGSTKTKLHPVQERIAKAHGSQCGFCTPGIVMSMYALLRNGPKPTMKDMEVAFQGNLCRCTGYRPIIEGFRTFTQEYQCAMGDQCCKVRQNGLNGNSVVQNGVTAMTHNGDVEEKLFEPSTFMPYDVSQEPIFPPELKLSNVLDVEPLEFRGTNITWYRPTTLNALLALKDRFPAAKIVVGNTEVGVEVKFKRCHYPILVMPNQIPELRIIDVRDEGVHIGAAVTFMDLDLTLSKLIEELPEYQTRLFTSVCTMLHYFAGKQIRNMASIGGNIMTGSPISDIIPIFIAAGIELTVQSQSNGVRTVKMGPGFFTGYRKNIITVDEVLVSMFIPTTTKNQHFIAYKQAKRRDDDIAIVNLALNVHFHPDSDIVRDIQLAFGGMAPTVVLTPNTSAKAIGQKWSRELIELFNDELVKELPLSPEAPGGMINYRRSLTLSLFFKAYLAISQALEKEQPSRTAISTEERSGAHTFHTLSPKSSQLFETDPDNQFPGDPVGRPKVHVSAYKQATGEAIYCDDMPKLAGELYLAFVLSTKAHANVISIDPSEALKEPGVRAFFSANDLTKHQNSIGPIFHDEEVFISQRVTAQGQSLGAIVADNHELAQRAARMVKVVLEDVNPIIVTIEEAIEHQSFYSSVPKIITNGDVVRGFEESDYTVSGHCRMGGQEHFYLETHVSYAIPRDNDELELYCSSQHPTEIQKMVAHILGVPACKIVAKVKRMGGGFGGKESRGLLVALPIALAAYRLGCPVRCMLDRDEDMMMTGTRHPFYFKYKTGFTKEGKLVACEIDIYNNAGYSSDLSGSVLERAMFHFTNAYYIPNVVVKGWMCRTNLPSNTAFRGFGGPQGMLAGENIIRDIAAAIGKDPIDVAYLNLYREGQLTHYNQELINCNLRRCWDECIKNCNYQSRIDEVRQFNGIHRWRKRGIAIVPTMFGISFTALFLNQSGALIHIYRDGSVLLSHGGTEMGQGLHTKMIQVASRALHIPADYIHISDTSTDKVPNTSATAASAGSDLNGMAILDACEKLLKRLKPYKEKYPDEDWKSWISKAYLDRISLSATGFYATPNIGYNFETNSGNPFNYFTCGVGCSEVEIDCLTGDHQVRRTDIVMDLGASLNPAIDIGQIEGGFMQGYGLFTLEEMVYSPTGTVYSRGPGMYKLPGFADIPGEFNVSLLKGASNPRAVFSSKAVGEPPLFLAASIFFAIKEAIGAARLEENLDPNFKLVSPATAARIRTGCEDKITKKFNLPESGTYTPWNVMP